MTHTDTLEGIPNILGELINRTARGDADSTALGYWVKCHQEEIRSEIISLVSNRPILQDGRLRACAPLVTGARAALKTAGGE